MMARLWRPQNVSFWYLIPVALVLHGLILRTPIALEEAPKEKPQTSPVKMQKIPSSKVAASPIPSSSPPPSSQPPIQQPVQPPVQPSVQQPIQQTIQQPVQPPVQPPIQQTVPPVQQPPVKTPDVFQIQGATVCDRVKDCYASAETNGRLIAQSLEEKLQAQGYTLTAIDLDEDTGMKVYHLFLNGQPKDYLHIIWTDKGTRSLRLPEPEKNYEQLLLKAKF